MSETGGSPAPLDARAARSELLRRTENWPRPARWHLRGRLRSCPFEAVLGALPHEGRIAGFGCGHGHLEILAALREPGRTLHACDVDARKIALGTEAARGLPVHLEAGEFFERVAFHAPFDGLVVCDVLYLIPGEEHRDLLQRFAALLRPGGVLVLKEVTTRPRWKHAWNVAQETLACKVLRITRSTGSIANLRCPASWIELCEAAGLAEITARRVDRGRPHAHLLVTARRPSRVDQRRR